MSTPDDTRFEEAFADLAYAAELMVDPVDPAVLHGRVRRRRTTRGALAAAVAALVVAVPAAWWLQESNGEEVDPPPPAEETTEETPSEEAAPTTTAGAPGGGPDGQETADTGALVLPTFGDLVGAELDLPEFFPGEGALNDACPVGPAVLADGTPDWEGGETTLEGGPVWLLKVIHTELEEGGPVRAVALLGCRPSEDMWRQAVVIDDDGNGGWEAGEQIALGDPGSFPLYDIAPAGTSGVLLMVTDQETMAMYEPAPVDYRIFRHRDGEEPVDVTGDAYLLGVTDLAVEARAEAQDDGTWLVTVEVTNVGDHESVAYQLSGCRSATLAAPDGDVPGCDEANRGVLVHDGLEPGESAQTQFTVEPGPVEEWDQEETDQGYTHLRGGVRPLTYSAEVLVYDPDLSNNDYRVEITADDPA